MAAKGYGTRDKFEIMQNPMTGEQALAKALAYSTENEEKEIKNVNVNVIENIDVLPSGYTDMDYVPLNDRATINKYKNQYGDVERVLKDLKEVKRAFNINQTIKGIEILEKTTEFVTGMLGVLTDEEVIRQLKESMLRCLANDDHGAVKNYTVALGIMIDKRIQLLESIGDGNSSGGSKIKTFFRNDKDGTFQLGICVENNNNE